ncbi:phosphoribosylanthranilate isomerase [Reichenbachiella sp. MALMAid0571]|uniref:phosphoribosylanthranilate isomerase n=1 Tax=Reichenbachiella sp. MALMAid0571 TaxID=3143939 RepID=UPI0032DFDFC5
MKVKVCGLNTQSNIEEVIAAGVDWIGLIFYSKSPRSVGKGDVDAKFVTQLNVMKVGVFVNEEEVEVKNIAEAYQLDLLQLHGDESPEYCESLKQAGYKIIKAFSVKDTLNEAELKNYEDVVDYFLFDTKGKNYGGNGMKFNWKALEDYKLSKPFLLSGGLTVEDAEDVAGLMMDALWGADLNSGFEIKPGLKDATKVKEFIKTIR